MLMNEESICFEGVVVSDIQCSSSALSTFAGVLNLLPCEVEQGCVYSFEWGLLLATHEEKRAGTFLMLQRRDAREGTQKTVFSELILLLCVCIGPD